jgi:DNA-binding transcriptional LysR family regulator
LDLNLLALLDTVLAERSVARAARRLHVTPSAVSNGLARLRGVLGDPLITRKGRGIVATPRAAELAPALARVMTELERLVSGGPFDAASCNRTFTLAMADTGQLAWLPRISARLVQVMPKAQLRVVGIDSLLALGDLSAGDVDLHVGVRATGPGIHAAPLFDEPTLLVARRGNPECVGKLSRQRLGRLKHVGVDMAPGRGLRDPLSAPYARAGIERQVQLRVPSFVAAAAVVAETDLVTTLPASLFAVGARVWGLTKVAGPVPSHAVGMALCWHERTHSDPAASAFRDLVRGALLTPRALKERKAAKA